MRLSITPWPGRSVLSFSFCSVLTNQTASYFCGTRRDPETQRGLRLAPVIFGRHLLPGETGENRVVSYPPFHVVLGLLAAGSSVSARRQLLAFVDSHLVDRLNSVAARPDVILPYDNLAEVPRIRCVNALWLDQSLTLNPSFKQILDSDYRAALHPVDFQNQPPHATQEINSWAENETSGLVKDFMREEFLSNSVKFVITNAIHFKGAWKYMPLIVEENKNLEMDPSIIAKGNALKDLKMVDQPFKKQSKYDYDRSSTVSCYPFKDTDRECVERVTENFKNLRDHQKTPKFNISSEEWLRGVGVTLPFFGKWRGMFSCFRGGKNLYVSSIFQKSFMETNEQGTEVVSITAAVVTYGRPPCLLLPPVPTLGHEYIYPLHTYDGTTAKTESVIIDLSGLIK
ncbi:serpin-ZX-like [Neltuma alba]|uniref:serpin-ZX-like n=1 Tax=Neltuma alba TaxID=207710 RepID=UPI0010A33DF1|nr:serpin-ZX-like [Prosopis alba]